MPNNTTIGFGGTTTEYPVDVGTMYDQVLTELEDLTRATLAAGLIARGMFNPVETKALVDVVNRIMGELSGV